MFPSYHPGILIRMFPVRVLFVSPPPVTSEQVLFFVLSDLYSNHDTLHFDYTISNTSHISLPTANVLFERAP